MLNNTISKCMNNGLKIDNVFDIGACSGSWSTNLQIQLLRNSKFFLFEANPTHLSELIISGMKYFFATHVMIIKNQLNDKLQLLMQ